MTDIQPYQPPATPALVDPTGGRLVAWAEAAVAAHQLAKSLAQTTFVPATFKNNANDATAAILMGDELGLSPLAALRSIYVVHGTPAMYARTMVALAQSHGHEVWTEMSTPAEVVVCGRRKGSEHVERSSWTIARATKAKYTSNAKYASNPEEMLYSKAAGEVVKKIAADVLAGVPLSVEDLELDDQATSTVTRGGTVSPERVKVQRAKAPDPEEPEFEAPAAPPPVVAADPITKQQMSLLHILLNANGLADRDAGLAFISETIGATIGSTKDLSKAQASKVIDTMQQEPAPADDGGAEPTLDEPDGWGGDRG